MVNINGINGGLKYININNIQHDQIYNTCKHWIIIEHCNSYQMNDITHL